MSGEIGDDMRMTAQQAYTALSSVYSESYGRPVDRAEDDLVVQWLLGHDWYYGRSVLDLGCGTAPILNHLSPRRYVGVDISPEVIEQANKELVARHRSSGEFISPGIQFVVGDMQRWRPPTRQWWPMVISLFGSMSYATSTFQSMQTAFDCCAPGGRVLFMLYGPRFPDRPGYLINRRGWQVPIHPRIPRDIKRLMRRAGFEDVRVRGMNALGDVVQRWLKGPALLAYLKLESALLSALGLQRWAYWQVVTARKPPSREPIHWLERGAHLEPETPQHQRAVLDAIKEGRVRPSLLLRGARLDSVSLVPMQFKALTDDPVGLRYVEELREFTPREWERVMKGDWLPVNEEGEDAPPNA